MKLLYDFILLYFYVQYHTHIYIQCILDDEKKIKKYSRAALHFTTVECNNLNRTEGRYSYKILGLFFYFCKVKWIRTAHVHWLPLCIYVRICHSLFNIHTHTYVHVRDKNKLKSAAQFFLVLCIVRTYTSYITAVCYLNFVCLC